MLLRDGGKELFDFLALLLLGLKREESEEFSIDMVGNPTKILGIIAKLTCIAINDEQFALIILDPRFVLVIQSLEIVNLHSLLISASAFLDLRHERRNRSAHIDKEVGHLNKRHPEIEEVAVVIEIAVGHLALLMKVRRENTCVLVDSAVLDNPLVLPINLDYVLESFVEEIDLQIE